MNYPGLANYQFVAKKYIFDIIQERYQRNEPMLERITHYLATEQDVKDFVAIFVDVYEKGYLKAVNDYRDKLKQMGYNVHIVSEKN